MGCTAKNEINSINVTLITNWKGSEIKISYQISSYGFVFYETWLGFNLFSK
jgi:hypothetical protein